MFKLTAVELDCAKAAIEHHSYSTLLPRPPEWDDLTEHWPVVRSYLSNLNLEQYTPRKPLTITAAKDEMSVRLVHLLHPEDMLLYTSLTLIVKDDIESVRVPRAEQRVYSYRASQDGGKLYDSASNTHRRYMDRLKRKARRRSTKAVAVTDVADFYASVSQDQLRRLLKEAARTVRSAKAAELLLSVFAASFMARKGHGIPTGPLASRLLAEVVLNEIDKHLMSKRIDFVRWVDDYNIFAPSLVSGRVVVRDLASWLYNHFGLTLQAAKTHVLEKEEYAGRLLVGVEKELADRVEILAELSKYHDYDPDELIDDVAGLMDDRLAVELLEMLVVNVIWGDEGVDYRAMAFIVRQLRRRPLDHSLAREVLEVLVENIDQLSPVITQVAPLIAALLPRRKMPKRIGKRLLKSLQHAGVDHHAVWILTIFAGRGHDGFLDALIDVYREAQSHATRRLAILAIAKSGGSVPYDRADWEAAPPLVRLALLKAGNMRGKRSLKPQGVLEELVARASRRS